MPTAEMMTLVSPVPATWRESTVAREPAGDRRLETLGFLSNRKPNTDVLQRGLAERAARVHGLTIRTYEKPNAAAGADQALIEQIARDCHAVVNGTGD